jgi:hypothetical protein
MSAEEGRKKQKCAAGKIENGRIGRVDAGTGWQVLAGRSREVIRTGRRGARVMFD